MPRKPKTKRKQGARMHLLHRYLASRQGWVPTRELREHFSISRHLVNSALSAAERNGLVESRYAKVETESGRRRSIVWRSVREPMLPKHGAAAELKRLLDYRLNVRKFCRMAGVAFTQVVVDQLDNPLGRERVLSRQLAADTAVKIAEELEELARDFRAWAIDIRDE